MFSTRANIIIRNGKRWKKDEREFRNVRNQTKERRREGGDRRSVMRARRSHVKKVSVRTSVNISLRKQSIEVVGERDDALTRGPATRKERLITLTTRRNRRKLTFHDYRCCHDYCPGTCIPDLPSSLFSLRHVLPLSSLFSSFVFRVT